MATSLWKFLDMTADQEVVAHCIVFQNRPFYYVWTEEGGGGGNAGAAIPRLSRASIELYCISLKSLVLRAPSLLRRTKKIIFFLLPMEFLFELKGRCSRCSFRAGGRRVGAVYSTGRCAHAHESEPNFNPLASSPR